MLKSVYENDKLEKVVMVGTMDILPKLGDSGV